jgi:hypothetical protein
MAGEGHVLRVREVRHLSSLNVQQADLEVLD